MTEPRGHVHLDDIEARARKAAAIHCGIEGCRSAYEIAVRDVPALLARVRDQEEQILDLRNRLGLPEPPDQ